MRILHVTDTYRPTLGGIEVLVESLSARQHLAGHEVTVLTRTAAGAGAAAPPDGAPSARRPLVVRDPAQLDRLVAEADCVHAHVSAISPLSFRVAEMAARQAVPVTVTVHSMWGMAWPVVRAVALARRWPDLPIQWGAVSEAAAIAVRRVVGEDQRVVVLPNAVETRRWAPEPRDCRPAGSSLTIVSVQRMARRKRSLPLLGILQHVRAIVPPRVALRAVIAGEGPQLDAVRSMTRRVGASSWVQTPGALTHAELRTLYREADVFVAPASLESFGLAALEARAAGLAVVGRAGTGVGDFVTHGVDGFLAEDDHDMARLLADLCTDRDLLATMVAHNRSRPPAFDWTDTLWRNDSAYASAMQLVATAAKGLPVREPASVSSSGKSGLQPQSRL